MARIVFISFVFAAIQSPAQLYTTNSGNIVLFAKAPMSDIRGESNQLRASLDVATGAVNGSVLIKGISFEKSLMRKHFNNRYMESDKFPEASFAGTITTDIRWHKPGVYEAVVEGSVMIHGVNKIRRFPVTISITKPGSLSVASVFKVRLADHGVEAPTLFFRTITEEVEVSLSLELAATQGKSQAIN